MIELKWVEPLPEQSLEGGVKLLNELKWNIEVREVNGLWVVNAGHVVLLETSSRESVDAFLYGMAIAVAALPERAMAELRKFVKESTE
jgi:hypothetical protein